jgi:hypothetical protein
MAWGDKEHRQRELESYQEQNYQRQKERDRASGQRAGGLPHYPTTNLAKVVGIIGLAFLGIALVSWILASKFNINLPKISGMSIQYASGMTGLVLSIVGLTPTIALYLFWLFIAIQIFGAVFLVKNASGNWVGIIAQILISIVYIRLFLAKDDKKI